MADWLEELFDEYAEIPVSDSVEAMASRLSGLDFLVPLAKPPDESGAVQLLVGQDNQGRSWAYLYGDLDTLADAVSDDAAYVEIGFEDAIRMAADNPEFGGVGFFSGEASYLLPADYFARALRGG